MHSLGCGRRLVEGHPSSQSVLSPKCASPTWSYATCTNAHMYLFHLAPICCIPPHLSMWPLRGWQREHAHTGPMYSLHINETQTLPVYLSHENAYISFDEACCYFFVPRIRIRTMFFSWNRLFRHVHKINLSLFAVWGVWCQLVLWGYVVQSCISPHWGHPLGTFPNAIGSKGLEALGQALPLHTGYSSDWHITLKGSLSEI